MPAHDGTPHEVVVLCDADRACVQRDRVVVALLDVNDHFGQCGRCVVAADAVFRCGVVLRLADRRVEQRVRAVVGAPILRQSSTVPVRVIDGMPRMHAVGHDHLPRRVAANGQRVGTQLAQRLRGQRLGGGRDVVDGNVTMARP
ncbi:hypothetical protein SAMN05661093_01689 [Kibdelosporangium aridum]|uniref:Uncharacterized protein n=1 Tax=Kibdelosporangium aridum TaxID=2030 RepID=A0A1Y5X5F7_KIBAR|nr:hypothetical protein SAMN05661093_01689 [Kibdelosporangium aridum]